jgi:type I restriction enzyme S subunit
MSVRAPVGPTNICNIEACIGRGLAAIRSGKNLDFKYLYFFLKAYEHKLAESSNGSTFSAITTGVVKEIPIPLPPLSTQRRIAEILDKADALRQKDQALLRKYDELAQAVFVDMFGDPVRNEKGWEVRKLGDCIDRIQIGPFGTQLHESDYIHDGIPIINPMHMKNLKVFPNKKYSITKEKYFSLEQYWLKENDVIMARRGEMGRCALITKQEAGFLCGTGSLFLSVNQSKLDPFFLVYLLSRDSTRKSLENVAAGTTMANLNKTIVSDFRIITPPVESQRAFSKAITLSENSINQVNASSEHSNYLFQSLLQKAFTGKLVE